MDYELHYGNIFLMPSTVSVASDQHAHLHSLMWELHHLLIWEWETVFTPRMYTKIIQLYVLSTGELSTLAWDHWTHSASFWNLFWTWSTSWWMWTMPLVWLTQSVPLLTVTFSARSECTVVAHQTMVSMRGLVSADCSQTFSGVVTQARRPVTVAVTCWCPVCWNLSSHSYRCTLPQDLDVACL